MKYRNIVLAIVALGLFLPKISHAFDPAIDCKKILTYANTFKTSLQTIFNKYTDTGKYSKKLDDGTYTLCFNPAEAYCDIVTNPQCDSIFTITATSSAPLLIHGLNLTTSATLSSALVTINGNVTAINWMLTGQTGKTGITVTGANAVIKNSTISNFDTGIQVGNATTVGDNISIVGGSISNATKGIYLASANNIEIEGVAFSLNKIGSEISPAYLFEQDYVGKKCNSVSDVEIGGVKYSTCDDTITDNNVKIVAGKAPIGLTECSGEISLYKVVTDSPKELIASCQLEKLAEEDAPLILVKGKNELKTIEKGECIFECEVPEGKIIDITNRMELSYSIYNGMLYSLNKDGSNKVKSREVLSNLVDWQSTGLGGIAMIGTVSEMTGGGDDVVASNDSGVIGAGATDETVATAGSATGGESSGAITSATGATAPIPECAADPADCAKTKASTVSEQKSDGGETIDSGASSGTTAFAASAGCGGSISTAFAPTNIWQMLMSAIFIFSLPSLIYCRARRK